MSMGFDEIKEWLDRKIAIKKEDIASDELCSNISTVGTSEYIQMYQGIEIVADVMGLPLNVAEFAGDTVYSFVYDGVKFIQFNRSDSKAVGNHENV